MGYVCCTGSNACAGCLLDCVILMPLSSSSRQLYLGRIFPCFLLWAAALPTGTVLVSLATHAAHSIQCHFDYERCCTIIHATTLYDSSLLGCNINASGFRAQADAMAGQGFRDAGYDLVLIQECISKSRSANGTIVVDPVKFPEGMPHLVGRDNGDSISACGQRVSILSELCLNPFPSPSAPG